MHTTTPPEITKQLKALAKRLSPNQLAAYLPVEVEADAVFRECFPNVEAKVNRDGGQMVIGWQLWEWRNVLIEAEFHAVWRNLQGKLIDITPKPDGEKRVLFVPDYSQKYNGRLKDNVRVPLTDDLVVQHFIKVSEKITKVMTKGDRVNQHGYLSIPEDEIMHLLDLRDLTGAMLNLGLGAHDPCICNSGEKYRRCHGKILR